jgi:hypothetical protein
VAGALARTAAPEIIKDTDGYDSKVDCWSLGVILYAWCGGALAAFTCTLHRGRRLTVPRGWGVGGTASVASSHSMTARRWSTRLPRASLCFPTSTLVLSAMMVKAEVGRGLCRRWRQGLCGAGALHSARPVLPIAGGGSAPAAECGRRAGPPVVPIHVDPALAERDVTNSVGAISSLCLFAVACGYCAV